MTPAQFALALALGRQPRTTPQAQKIQHVVIIVQENRSFDNLFQGYPGADTVSQGLNSQGQTVQLQPISLAADYDIEHLARDMFAACDGTGSLPGTDCRMDAFDKEYLVGKGPANPEYGYVPAKESKPYFDIAQQYVVGDRMFASHVDASFVSHQYLVAAQANSGVDLPSAQWACGGGKNDMENTLTAQRTYGQPQPTCRNYRTLADELDAAAIPWRFYANTLTDSLLAYGAVKHIRYGPDWAADVVAPSQQFITDVGNGELAGVTWITPSCANSDHAGCLGKGGPAWVTSLVNAVGESRFWSTTAIFVMWDEWGGWYDHVAPPTLDYDGLGFRVPLVVVSPYAKKNYVSHVQYEHGSILRFAEDTFGLPQLAASDARATSPAADCFDFSKPPRKFKPFAARPFARNDPRPVDRD